MSIDLDNKEDMEVIAMANHAVSSKNSARAGPELVDPAPVAEYEEIPEEAYEIRGMDLATFGSVCARGFLGLMFLAAACFVWAVVCWRKHQHRR